ncbi:MAG: HYR domain-containing protein [Chitinophagales bacterium]|nr:HYR domain-containing protein [Chitinophagales bacterium]
MTALAQAPLERRWNGTVSDNWNDAANWTPNGLPAPTDSVVIPFLYQVNLPVIPAGTFSKMRNLTVRSQLTINAGATVEVEAPLNSTALFNLSDIVNRGTITVKSGLRGITNREKIENYGVINLGVSTASPYSFKDEGLVIDSYSSPVINYQGAVINIKRTGNNGILILANSDIANYGQINIDQTGLSLDPVVASTGDGIDVQDGHFINYSTGDIYINRSGANGFRCQSPGVVSNYGMLDIFQPGQTPELAYREGIQNNGLFTNYASGSIQINQTSNSALFNQKDFNNYGLIELGTSGFGSIGNFGLVNFNEALEANFVNHTGSVLRVANTAAGGIFSGGVFSGCTITNQAGATMEVNNVMEDGVQTYAQAALDNFGVLEIGHTGTVGRYGIYNAGQMVNQVNGSISIKNTADHAIFGAEISGFSFEYSFRNGGILTIGQTTGSGKNAILTTTGSNFENLTCYALIDILGNNPIVTTSGADFRNQGSIVERATGNSNINANFGTIQNLNGGTFTISNTNEGVLTSLTNAAVWTGCVSSDWANTGNWHNDQLPGALSRVIIPDTDNDPVIGSGALITVNSLQVLTDARLTNNGELELSGSSVTRLDNQGLFINNGKLLLAATNAPTDFGIKNTGNFTNERCAYIDLKAHFNNSGNFDNRGLFMVNAVVTLSNSNLTNLGIIEYNVANLSIPNVNNNGLIVPYYISGACSVNNPLQVSGNPGFSIATTWSKSFFFNDPGATYNAGNKKLTFTNIAGGTAPILYFDITNNSLGCTHTGSIQTENTDVTAPSITCPANTTVSAGANCSTMLGAYALAAKSDNCAATVSETQSPAASTLLSGHNAAQTVTFTANDGNGNTATCQFTVTVKDVTAPSITCPANTTVSAGANCSTMLGAYALASKSDNCAATVSETQSPAASTLLSGHNAAQTVTFTANDGNGNTATCQFTVTVKDVTAPSITCPANTTVSAGANCSTMLGAYALASKSDNCAATVSETQSPAASTLLSGHNAAQTVTFTANDGNGNTATCQFTVTLKDVTAPSITCPANTTVSVGANCSTMLGAYALAAKSDNCAATVSETQSPAASTMLSGHNAAQTVTFTANDGNGNTATCQFTVTVKDVTAPSITCPANTTVSAGANCSTMLGAYALASKSDNCAATVSETQSPAASTMLSGHNAAQTVTFMANDGNGNTATCQFTVTVKDVTAPTVVCKLKNEVGLNASGQASLTPAEVFAGGGDNCGTLNFTAVTPNSFTCSNLGINVITLTVNDGNGNPAACTANVVVLDKIAPTMQCRPVTLNLDAFGQASVTAAQVNNGSFDNCTLASLTLSQTQFSCANIGNNIVTLTGADQSGNTAQCTAIITLRDLIVPVAKCKNATVNLAANGTLTLNPALLNNGSTDNCSLTFMATPATFNCSNIGNNTVTLRATDTGGNSATCTAILTVSDLSAPVALCKAATVVLDQTGQGTLTVAQVDNGSSDACGILSRTLSESNFDCSEVRNTPWPVFLTVRDVNGNTATCTAMVTVRDLNPPTAICENVTVNLGPNGKVTVYPAELAQDSYDNCAVWSFSPVAKIYTTANLGQNNLSITVRDLSGNAATCVSVVTVLPNSSNMQGNNNHANHNQSTLESKMALSVYPNPNNGVANAAIHLAAEQAYTLRIFDISGRELFKQISAGIEGMQVIPLPLQGFSSGVYLVNLQSEGQQLVQKMIIQRE